MSSKNYKLWYEIAMFSLVILSLFTLPFNNLVVQVLNVIIWFIFFVDYMYFFIKAPKKMRYVREHWIELIALIPLDSIFRAVRALRILRLSSIGSRYFTPVFLFLKEKNLHKIFIALLILLLIIPIPIFIIEPDINSYADAFWWTIVTVTTVGYGDLSPITNWGRGIAGVLMLLGIGIIGVVTSITTSFFISSEKDIAQIIADVEKLTEEDKDKLRRYLN
ncbi:potassium channel family protein [Listeria ivanovii]|uniref:Putative potassium channel subunit n=1 Tax=Listeria ivanovii (strain ATCC BAA-678 / PAM 55) TaxID=881621 RepID=G2Z8W2_LISIP|nr:potassium channel family protein [Listeria ivanovii]AHI54705.1 potassium channel protein [Listeria ivanovii WSLC3009]AIS64173.1 ion transporter [Listeria ivanovii subsp. ivanovii]MBC1760669.1 potassium channel family protein [Listeria ivanovii]MBK3915669.1 potassium channel family protein [Listeria ivanovii subsp. ivanovii]MBK3922781.1 potassium channel family protein [Listeria ivanovii subsp. ivanovii]